MSDSEDDAPDTKLKLVVMGDGASGKVSQVAMGIDWVYKSRPK